MIDDVFCRASGASPRPYEPLSASHPPCRRPSTVQCSLSLTGALTRALVPPTGGPSLDRTLHHSSSGGCSAKRRTTTHVTPIQSVGCQLNTPGARPTSKASTVRPMAGAQQSKRVQCDPWQGGAPSTVSRRQLHCPLHGWRLLVRPLQCLHDLYTSVALPRGPCCPRQYSPPSPEATLPRWGPTWNPLVLHTP